MFKKLTKNLKLSVYQESLLRNISGMGVSTVFSSFLLFFANLIVAREIGPEEYGKYSLVLSLSNLFVIPILFSLHLSATKYFSSHPRMLRAASFLFLFVISSGLLVYGLGTLFENEISGLMRVPGFILRISLIYSFVLSLKYLAEGILRGIFKIKELALLEVASSGLILMCVLFILFNNDLKLGYVSYVFSILAGFMLFMFGGLFVLRKKITWPSMDNIVDLKTIFHYSFYGVLGGVGNFLISNADKLILSNISGFSELGLLTLYQNISNTINGQILVVVNTVILPEVSKIKDHSSAYKKVRPKIILIMCGALTLHFIGIFVLSLLLGNKYVFDLLLAGLVSLSAAMFLILQIPLTFNIAMGVKGIRRIVFVNLAVSLISPFLNYFLIGLIGVYGLSIIATLNSFILLFIYQSFLRNEEN